MHIAAGCGQFGLVKYFTKDCQMDPQTVNEVRCVNPLVRVTDVVCMIYGTGQKKLGDFCIFPLLDNATVCSWPRSCLRVLREQLRKAASAEICVYVRTYTYAYMLYNDDYNS